MVAHTPSCVAPVVEHWLDDLWHHERTLYHGATTHSLVPLCVNRVKLELNSSIITQVIHLWMTYFVTREDYIFLKTKNVCLMYYMPNLERVVHNLQKYIYLEFFRTYSIFQYNESTFSWMWSRSKLFCVTVLPLLLLIFLVCFFFCYCVCVFYLLIFLKSQLSRSLIADMNIHHFTLWTCWISHSGWPGNLSHDVLSLPLTPLTPSYT